MPNKLMTNYGWVQNTSNLITVRETLMLVPDYGIRHSDLREAIRNYREDLGNLPRLWTWDARCRIKAIHALGLVKLNREIQGYELTHLGAELKAIGNRDLEALTAEEIAILKKGLLTSPPVVRVLTLLYENFRGTNSGLTKYDIGAKLGFVGDIGFTHYDPFWIANNNLSFNDKEGDADKWARTILSWLTQVGWATKVGNILIVDKPLGLYKTSAVLDSVFRYDLNRTSRNVAAEMLCSNHHPFPKLIQKRRSQILTQLAENPKSKTDLINALVGIGIEAGENTIEFEILNLRQAGFRILENGGYYTLQDTIVLDTPIIGNTEQVANNIEQLIEENVVRYENTIPARLIDQLIRYGYDGNFGPQFESIVGEFLRFLGYNTTQLGQGRGRVADVLARYVHPTMYARSYALIIDAKATSNRYNFPAGDIRKMKEYINLHGPDLARETITNHAFSFVSSDFVPNVSPAMVEIAGETQVNGSAIKVMQLLELGNKVVGQQVNIDGLFTLFTNNSDFQLPN